MGLIKKLGVLAGASVVYHKYREYKKDHAQQASSQPQYNSNGQPQDGTSRDFAGQDQQHRNDQSHRKDEQSQNNQQYRIDQQYRNGRDDGHASDYYQNQNQRALPSGGDAAPVYSASMDRKVDYTAS
jgi:hypothetical protein